jgi:hypothetical protein
MIEARESVGSQIRKDIVEETSRLVGAAAEQGVPLRVVGGLAVRLHAPGGIHPALERPFKDIDLVTVRGKGGVVIRFMESMGYEPSWTFNTMNSGRRALFRDLENERQVDLFVEFFEMCHVIPITERIGIEPVTVPLAELLLTKLQVVTLNEKDQRDIFALLYEHKVGEGDTETVNSEHVARLCANDWGLWRTCKLNVERSRVALAAYDLSPADRDLISRRLEALWDRIEVEPKGSKWKLRNRMGDRKRWYEEPDEVG